MNMYMHLGGADEKGKGKKGKKHAGAGEGVLSALLSLLRL
jgi:hypothetical protein